MAKEIFVSFGIDVDAVAGWLGSYGGEDSPCDISRGLFAGEVGSLRLLRLFTLGDQDHLVHPRPFGRDLPRADDGRGRGWARDRHARLQPREPGGDDAGAGGGDLRQVHRGDRSCREEAEVTFDLIEEIADNLAARQSAVAIICRQPSPPKTSPVAPWRPATTVCPERTRTVAIGSRGSLGCRVVRHWFSQTPSVRLAIAQARSLTVVPARTRSPNRSKARSMTCSSCVSHWTCSSMLDRQISSLHRP